jgi:hypothetical protein
MTTNEVDPCVDAHDVEDLGRPCQVLNRALLEARFVEAEVVDFLY